ncbi:NUDIX domain-containing protein [Kribbella sp. NPDC051620]|uniref:NUDIX domain-containing protein n=1 Tax=Kribbella sp. NPDC051620 TaxID=3364120 RepID=UPI00378B5A9F
MSTDTAFTVAQPRVAAGAIFRDLAGAVLLVKPNYKPLWDLPGGYVEPGETPREACAREVLEELGLQRAIGSPLVVDWAPAPGEGDKLLFVFDGGQISPSELDRIRLQAAEIDAVGMFMPQEFPQVLPARLQRRVAAALDALWRAQTIYLEPTR